MRVMTRNLFIGADLAPAYRALATTDALAGLPAVVAAIFNPGDPPGVVQRTDFPARAVRLADEIEAARPDLIGVQEAARWRTQDPSGSETVFHDHLELLEAELTGRGLRYRVLATVDNGDVALPSSAGLIVGLSNRGAILARVGPDAPQPSNVQTGTFANTLPVHTTHGTFALVRGWASVDARFGDGSVRLITTHLEVANSPEAAEVQLLQAGELLDGPARTDLPVVLLGDFNSRPGSVTYSALLAAGFDDAWTRANPDAPGLTCCHPVPLDDPVAALRARIDLVLTRGEITATDAFVTGAAPEDFRAGRWASDHAGVVATLEFGHRAVGT